MVVMTTVAPGSASRRSSAAIANITTEVSSTHASTQNSRKYFHGMRRLWESSGADGTGGGNSLERPFSRAGARLRLMNKRIPTTAYNAQMVR